MNRLIKALARGLAAFCLATSVANAGAPADFFVITVDATAADETPAGQMTIPSSNTNYQLSWEEVGNESGNNSSGFVHITAADHVINFGSSGIYRIKIDPVDVPSGVNDFSSFRFRNAKDDDKILTVEQWGSTIWSNFIEAFKGASNFTGFTAEDTPNLSVATNLYGMFQNTPVMTNTQSMASWDFTDVTSLFLLFTGSPLVNPDTSNWNTSSVTTMGWMFNGAATATPNTSNWDVSSVTSFIGMFAGATSANPDTSSWNTSSVTTMWGMFWGAGSANPNTSGWNTASVTSMQNMFNNAGNANPDTSGWDTSSVTNMSSMFNGASLANPNVSSWNTAAVTNMSSMFTAATSANPDVSAWNTSAVTNMSSMFNGASVATPNTSSWNTSSVTLMSSMFRNASVANPDTSGWNTSSVTTFNSMFFNASVANPDTSNWNTSAVKSLNNMFYQAPLANPDVSGWDTSAVTTMAGTFQEASSANPDVSGWDTSLVTTLRRIFYLASSASPDVTNWNTSSVTNMVQIFAQSAANPDVSGWDTSSAVLMNSMFSSLSSFDADLSHFDFSVVTDANNMLNGVTLSKTNYDALLSSLATQSLQADVAFHGGNSHYCSSETDRANIVSTFNWTITDGGLNCNEQSLLAVLEDSASVGGANNADGTAVTAVLLSQIVGVVNVNAGNESEYQAAIALETGFSNPPSEPEVQAIIDAVNEPHYFIFTVDSTLSDASPIGQMIIPSSNSNYQLFWEEVGNEASNNSNGPVHITVANQAVDFGSAGIYRVKIDSVGVPSGSNDFDRFRFVNSGDKNKFIGVQQWGSTAWSTMNGAFYGAVNFSDYTATDTPDLSAVTLMSYMFADAVLANPDVSTWDTSTVTNMEGVFSNADSAIPDVSNWNTSSVINMQAMFAALPSMNPDVSNWNTSSVTNMSFMFYQSEGANPDVSSWDTSQVTTMWGMFNGAIQANPDVSEWDTGAVSNITGMFANASQADPNLNNFDFSNVTAADSFLANISLSRTKYDQLLGSIDAQILKTGVTFHAGDSVYCEGEAARTSIIANDGWVLNDGGKDCSEIYLAEILEDSNSVGGGSNVNGIPISVAQLAEITGLTAVHGGNEADYQAAIASEIGFSNPPTVAEVQLIIDTVNASKYFIIIADTTAADETPIGQMTIPSLSTNYQLFWEEVGNEAANNSGGAVQVTTENYVIDFGSPGVYRIKIDPVGVSAGLNDFNHFSFNSSNDDDKVLDLEQWGTTSWSNLDRMFRGASRFIGDTASDFPDLSLATSLVETFRDAPLAIPNTSGWNTSSVNSMYGTFYGASAANPDVSGWDTSSVTTMYSMFKLASVANPDVSGWDTSSVRVMSHLFNSALLATPDVSGWNTSSAISMNSFFYNAPLAVPDVGSWDTSSVTTVQNMFNGASLANPDVSGWDTSSMTNMLAMFSAASSANPDVSSWDTSAVTTLYAMFNGASIASPDVSAWDISAVTSLGHMFRDTNVANPDVSNWNTSSVTSMAGMFLNSSSANPDVSGWDTSSVTDMQSMFRNTDAANPDVSGWDTSLVVDMQTLFTDAAVAQPDISGWNMSSVTQATNMLSGVTLPLSIYDAFLINLSAQTLQANVPFHGGFSQYCNGSTARADVEFNDGWTFIDGSLGCTELRLLAVLEDSASVGGANNSDETSVTASQLNEIDGLQNVYSGNIAAYQEAIGAETGFSNPPTVAQVQALVDNENELAKFIITVDASVADESPIGQMTLATPNTNYQVTWEEVGNEAANNSGGVVHISSANYVLDFGASGIYRIKFDPAGVPSGANDFTRYVHQGSHDDDKLLSVDQWGSTHWTSMLNTFQGASRVTFTASDTPNFSSVSSMKQMFYQASMASPDTSNWDTSAVTDMGSMFREASAANPDTSGWDTSAVINMNGMFRSAVLANPDTSNWDTSAVTGMVGMFYQADSAIPDTSAWNTASVTSMSSMFQSADLANPDTSAWVMSSVTDLSAMFQNATLATPNTGNWDTSAVTNLANMFYLAGNANPDTRTWNTSAVTNMASVFQSASSANPDTSTWDTSSVLFMQSMFYDADNARPDTSGWDTSSVTDMRGMFRATDVANPDTSNWDTSSVSDMSYMFFDAAVASPDTSGWNTGSVTTMQSMFSSTQMADPLTGGWDTSSVTNMSNMFKDTGFANPDTSSWNTSSVTNMSGMFNSAVSANPDLSNFDFSNVSNVENFLAAANLSTIHYDNLLANLDGQILQTGLSFHGGSSNYCVGEPKKINIENTYGWTFVDGGRDCTEPYLLSIQEDSSSDGGANNFDGSAITVAHLLDITGLNNVIANNEAVYQTLIAAESNFSNPPTVSQVQALIDQANDWQTNSDLFVFIVDASVEGASAVSSFVVPSSNINYQLYWEELDNEAGNNSAGAVQVTSGSYQIDFPTPGQYRIAIDPLHVRIGVNDFNHFAFSDGGDKLKLLNIEQWGAVPWATFAGMFYGAQNLTAVSATDMPNLSVVSAMNQAFSGTSSLAAINGIGNWDVSTISSMYHTFSNSAANPDIANWDTSSVLSFEAMFSGTSQANPDTSGWDTSAALTMASMFHNAQSAIPDTSVWDTSSVTNMRSMFQGSALANPNTSNWNTSSVTDMRTMFSDALSANPDVGNWDTSLVTIFEYIFQGAASADPDVSGWNLSSASNVRWMFLGSGLSMENYDEILIAWAVKSLPNNLDFSAGFTQYCDGADAKDVIINSFNWTMADGGRNCSPYNLAEILEDSASLGGSSNANTTLITAAELADVAGILNVYSGNETNYQLAITQESGFSNPPTVNEVQALINTVNQQQYFIMTVDASIADETPAGEMTISSPNTNYQLYWEEVGNEVGNNSGGEIQIGSGYSVLNFGSPGIYRIKIDPVGVANGNNDFNRIHHIDSNDDDKLLDIEQWGSTPWISMQSAFHGASKLTVSATDVPDLSLVTTAHQMFAQTNLANPDVSAWDISNISNLSQMFWEASVATPDVSNWNTSSVTNLVGMFTSATLANPDVSNWDTSSVTSMASLFSDTETANPNVSTWDTSQVTDMNRMFLQAKVAMPDTSNWNTAQVTNMYHMFSGADLANPDTTNWNVSSVTTMQQMFQNALNANPNTSSWDTSSVSNMRMMFIGADNANPVTTNWNTANVTDMSLMFHSANVANPDTSNWDTSAVTNVSSMFYQAVLANPDTSGWDTSAVTTMADMFNGAVSANPDTSGWDTSAVTNMQQLFSGLSLADPDVSAWNTSLVTNMNSMFSDTAFRGDISHFNFENVAYANGMLNGVTLSTHQYDDLLASLSSQTLQPNVTFSGGRSTYCLSESERTDILNNDGWLIADGGRNCTVTNLLAILEDSSSPGGGNNTDGLPTTAIQLSEIDGIVGVIADNQFEYQSMIAVEDGFSNPPRVSEVQILIDSVNLSQSVLEEVLEDSASVDGASNNNGVLVSASQLISVFGLTGVEVDRESLYQEQITLEQQFHNLPTLQQVQAIIDRVNRSEASLTEVLEDSLSAGGSSNANGVLITATQLGNVIGLNAVENAYESEYQAAIQAEAGFSTPPSLAQVQTLVLVVNSQLILEAVLEDSLSPGGAGNVDGIFVTALQLSSIVGIRDVDINKQSLYQGSILANSQFSNPPTLSEVQALIDEVNASEAALAEALEDSNSVNGENNTNNVAISVEQLSAIMGLRNVLVGNESHYQFSVAQETDFDTLPTLVQIQVVIDAVNTEVVLAQVLEESASPGSQLTVGQEVITTEMLQFISGISSVIHTNEFLYQQAIAEETEFSNPVTLSEVQVLIDDINARVTASNNVLWTVLHSSVSQGSNGNGSDVTMSQLSSVLGLTNLLANNLAVYQAAIAVEPNFSQPPTVEQLQSLIGRVNSSERARTAILEASLSEGGGQGEIPISIDQLQAVDGIQRLEPTNESAYHAAIATETEFSNPPSSLQIQQLVDRVNASESTLIEILYESSTLGGTGQGNISIEQLNTISGLRGVQVDSLSLYQAAIGSNADFSNPPTLEEVQALIDGQNDEDGDGIPDSIERGYDSDIDGVPDNMDLDSDNDTISDLIESSIDTDGDGVPDFRDLDSDNDGIVDQIERLLRVRTSLVFDSNDTVVNDSGNPSGTTLSDVVSGADMRVLNQPLADSDGDGVADFRDLDTDNDGLPDVTEAGVADLTLNGLIDGVDIEDLMLGLENSGTDAGVDENGLVEQASYTPRDSDGDSIPDFRDLDSDNDSLTDIAESFGTPWDVDGDGQLDNFIDMDNDGVSDTTTLDANAQLDVDEDGLFDYVDIDSDADGLSDLLENGGVDTDNDGRLDDIQDVDGNGLDDSIALFPMQITDTDSDGIPDYKDTDSDNDGVSDLIESGGIDANGDGRAEALTENPASAVDIVDPVNAVDPDLLAPESALPEVITVGKGGSSGCSVASIASGTKMDPLLPGLAITGLTWLALRRRNAAGRSSHSV